MKDDKIIRPIFLRIYSLKIFIANQPPSPAPRFSSASRSAMGKYARDANFLGRSNPTEIKYMSKDIEVIVFIDIIMRTQVVNE